MGRFVGFKNLLTLLDAVAAIPDVTLTLVGAGPMEQAIRARIAMRKLDDRVTIHAPVRGEEKGRVFAEHDLLVLPSVTEISPNVALEAAAEGLTVLLTEETGLRETERIRIRPLRTKEQIAEAIGEYVKHYECSQKDAEVRTYAQVAQDWLTLISSL